MKLLFGYHPDETHILPSLCLIIGRCEDLACQRAHGWALCFHWLWWTIALEAIH